MGGGDAQQPQHRRREVEAVQVDRRDGAVPFGQPHRRHPEADVARDAHAAGLTAQARVGGADLVFGGQLQSRLLGGDLGEHRVDRLRRDRHQRRLHPLEQRRLVLVGADDQRDRMGAALAGQLHRVVGYHVAVDDRGERQRAGIAHGHVVEHVGGGRDDRVDRNVWQPVDVGCRQAQPVEHLAGDAVGPADVVNRCGRRALRDRGGEQALGGRAGEQRGDDARACRFAEERDTVGISAERGDVVAYPAQRRQHVAQPEIGVEPAPRGVELGQVEESERAEPVVHGDDDHLAATGQHSAVVERLARRAQDVGPAVHPHHHRLAVTGRGVRRRPDIEGQAVLALRRAEVDRDPGVDGLRADAAEAGRVGDVGPALRAVRAPATSGRRSAARRTARPSMPSRGRRRGRGPAR